jgi:hypothetical protein
MVSVGKDLIRLLSNTSQQSRLDPKDLVALFKSPPVL